MGVIRREGSSKLYFRYHDGTKWKTRPSIYFIGQELEARAAFRDALKKAEKTEAIATAAAGGFNLSIFAERFFAHRRAQKKAIARTEESQVRIHVLPVWGSKRPEEIGRGDVKAMIARLVKTLRAPKTKAEKRGEVKITETLAPRTIAGIMTSARALFAYAVEEELIATNPIKLTRGMLPVKRDRKINRRRDVFVRQEIETIISSPKIPIDRRALYGLLFLDGPRPEELVVMRLRNYERDREILGCISVDHAWSTELGEIKDTKTGVPREVPVHPMAAALIAEWLLQWSKTMGRKMTVDDLLFPAPPAINERDKRLPGGIRGIGQLNYRFKQDLEKIGIRPRNIYMARHSFISMARSAGVQKDDLQWITHGVRLDVIDGYTIPTWESLCSHVLKVKAERLKGEVVAMPKAVNSHAGDREFVTVAVTDAARQMKKPPSVEGLEASTTLGAAGFERAEAVTVRARPSTAVSENPIGWVAAAKARAARRGLVCLERCDDCDECGRLHAELETAQHDEDAPARRLALAELEQHQAEAHPLSVGLRGGGK